VSGARGDGGRGCSRWRMLGAAGPTRGRGWRRGPPAGGVAGVTFRLVPLVQHKLCWPGRVVRVVKLCTACTPGFVLFRSNRARSAQPFTAHATERRSANPIARAALSIQPKKMLLPDVRIFFCGVPVE
jgi:hypothetical protein